jgi:hypothetical protein
VFEFSLKLPRHKHSSVRCNEMSPFCPAFERRSAECHLFWCSAVTSHFAFCAQGRSDPSACCPGGLLNEILYAVLVSPLTKCLAFQISLPYQVIPLCVLHVLPTCTVTHVIDIRKPRVRVPDWTCPGPLCLRHIQDAMVDEGCCALGTALWHDVMSVVYTDLASIARQGWAKCRAVSVHARFKDCTVTACSTQFVA